MGQSVAIKNLATCLVPRNYYTWECKRNIKCRFSCHVIKE